MQPLYDVAIVERSTTNDAEDGMGARLVCGPTAVVSTDAQSAALSSVMDDEIGWVWVLVRPVAYS